MAMASAEALGALRFDACEVVLVSGCFVHRCGIDGHLDEIAEAILDRGRAGSRSG